MIPLFFMLLRTRPRIDWYDLIFAAFAALIVFPDHVLDWLSSAFQKPLGWWHLICLEVISAGALAAFTLWLMPRHPQVDWWLPILFIGGLAVVRLVIWLVARWLGLNRSP